MEAWLQFSLTGYQLVHIKQLNKWKEAAFEQENCVTVVEHSNYSRHSVNKSLHGIAIPWIPSIKSP